ncbi:unnamed protein product [Plutella xylostella]|uniref:(diamondback moth) hypothetical protein n=1 Tax=Plutella xylostella TaxID=51655 RepID=A0A8S4G6T3_PLUXY|nr:unnamed protein product [Plutella xylostella]
MYIIGISVALLVLVSILVHYYSDIRRAEELATPQEASQAMYIIGISVALLVLVVSILVHYYSDIRRAVGNVV